MRDCYVTTDEINKIMDKLKCNKIIFDGNGKAYVNNVEIDWWNAVREIRGY